MIIGKLKKRFVLIEEDDRLRNGVGFTIESNTSYLMVNAYKACSEAVKNVTRDCPDIIVMDLLFTDMDGLEALRIIKEKYPFSEIIIYTNIDDTTVINEVLGIGVSGYILKTTLLHDFLRSLDIVLQGGGVLSPQITRKVMEFFRLNPFSPLSDRETEVLKLMTMGKTYSEISEQLNISLETSKTHIRNIYKKLNVNSKSEAVKKALHDKLISVGAD
jgi:DNA-binding NarL/FixJ family response regulator